MNAENQARNAVSLRFKILTKNFLLSRCILVENIVKLSYLLFSMGFLPKKANRLPKVLK